MKVLITTIVIFATAHLAFSQSINAELVKHETNITINNSKLTKKVTIEIQINNRDGEEYTKISIPNSGINKVSNINAYIKDKNGNIIKKLKKEDITNFSAISNISFYEDTYAKEFTLKHNEYPYTIVYSYQEVQNEFLYIDYWFPLIDTNIPTHKATLLLETPLDYKLTFKNQNIEKLTIDTTTTSLKYMWVASYNEIIKSEIFAPLISNFLPNVLIVPNNFKYNLKGSFATWQTYGKWQHQLLEGLSEITELEESKIKSLVSGISEEREIIKTLYHYLQDETRYINVTIETGGLKPYPATYVCNNKYGDCKALTNYFKAILEKVGIKSYYTKVHAGDIISNIDLGFPSQQFNHIILCIPTKNDTIWLDCTSDSPFGYLGTFTQNRKVFVINDSSSIFTNTPPLKLNDVTEERIVKFIPGITFEALANFNIFYKGDEYESLSYLERFADESRKKQIVMRNFIENGFEATDFKINTFDRDSSIINLTYMAKSKKVYNKYDNDIVISILPIGIPKFEKPNKRKLPIQINYPIYKKDRLEYKLPEGYTTTGSLTKQEIYTDYGKYSINYLFEHNKVVVLKMFILNSGNYSLNQYSDFYNFINSIREIDTKTYISTTKEN